jgi:ABC-type Fe3+-hydroxamate transport system substrate-binding protein
LTTAYPNVTLLNTTTGLVTIQKTFTLNEVSSNTSTLKCVVTDATNTSVTVNATCQFVVTYGGNTFVTGISPSSQIKYGWSNYPGSTNATVLLTASGGVPPYTYQWSMVESFGGVSLLGGWGPAVELKKVWSQYETSYDTNIVQCVVKDSGGNSQTVTAKVTFSIYHLV